MTWQLFLRGDRNNWMIYIVNYVDLTGSMGGNETQTWDKNQGCQKEDYNNDNFVTFLHCNITREQSGRVFKQLCNKMWYNTCLK